MAKELLNGNGGKTRYSDQELKEFKQIILEKKKKTAECLQLLKRGYIMSENDTTDTSPEFRAFPEGGRKTSSIDETDRYIALQEKFIKHLDNALIRIENKSYGICAVTGKLIPKERLRVVPHATLSVEAKRQQSTKVMVPFR